MTFNTWVAATNVTVVKSVLQMMGEDCGPTRHPSAWPLTESQTAKLRTQLAAWGVGRSAAKAARG